MSTNEIARSLRARRYAKGKWMAKCPAHKERTSSLSITDMGEGFTRLHCFAGCSQADVVDAAGLEWRDLRPKSDVPLVIMERLTMEDKREALERQLGLALYLKAIDGKPAYWEAARRRINGELDAIRCKLEPQKIYQEYRERQFQRRVKTLGWERLWDEV